MILASYVSCNYLNVVEYGVKEGRRLRSGSTFPTGVSIARVSNCEKETGCHAEGKRKPVKFFKREVSI